MEWGFLVSVSVNELCFHKIKFIDTNSEIGYNDSDYALTIYELLLKLYG
jgi:hypothetical protein